ncbi:hypothetical protein HPB49_007420 [Dermacentor silvarum]|uniref:Uncharacterized protein n=1 Tax=Dermacentor silvarum TaxID=543639 RepID=A0ACB8C7W6_DERSI|nr:hypothetical protein HPB49_007420 [Dermacentor silvarum]
MSQRFDVLEGRVALLENASKDARPAGARPVKSKPCSRPPAAKNSCRENSTLNVVDREALIIVRDFGAPHFAWAYTIENDKGRNLRTYAQHEGLTLITNPQDPTRMGNSVNRDTTPDLTFIKNIANPKWTYTNITLGSDHCIANTMLQAGLRDATTTRLEEHQRKDNVDRDAPITEGEIRYELGRLNPKSTRVSTV